MPKVGISYAWSTTPYEERVASLANRLKRDGIDVILDKWVLKPGNDLYAFMEALVADDTIDFVLILCDRFYQAKANSRFGGVGTEARLIAPAIHASSWQTKFVPLVMERASDGTPYLPAFLNSRVYIDFSSASDEEASYGKLLAHIKEHHETENTATRTNFSGPDLINQKPEHGKPQLSLPDQIRSILSPMLPSGTRGEAAADYVQRTLPVRNLFLSDLYQQFNAQQNNDDSMLIARHIEHLLEARSWAMRSNITPSPEVDAFNFLTRELWLHIVAKLIQQHRWNTISTLLESHFAIKNGYSLDMIGYGRLWSGMPTIDIEYNNERNLNKISLSSEFMRQRTPHERVEFSELAQADLLLWVRSIILPSSSRMQPSDVKWWPATLSYFVHLPSPDPFPIAARWRVGQQEQALLAFFGLPSRVSLFGRLSTPAALASIAQCTIDGWRLDVLGFLGLRDINAAR